MKTFVDVGSVYLHREPVDFRKAIDGLSLIVSAAPTTGFTSHQLNIAKNYLQRPTSQFTVSAGSG